MVWYGMVWYGMVRYGTVRYGTYRYGAVRYGMVWYGMVWYGTVRYGAVRCGAVRCGAVRCGAVRYGMVWYGMVWYGMVWYGMVWYGRKMDSMTLSQLNSRFYRAEYECFQIELAKNYGVPEWREDVKKVMMKAGLENKSVVFLFVDTQVCKYLCLAMYLDFTLRKPSTRSS
jgi:hypothetical protein